MEHTYDTLLDRSADSVDYEPTPDAQIIGAFYSYVDHGSVPGHEVRDWLETEARLINDRRLERRA